MKRKYKHLIKLLNNNFNKINLKSKKLMKYKNQIKYLKLIFLNKLNLKNYWKIEKSKNKLQEKEINKMNKKLK